MTVAAVFILVLLLIVFLFVVNYLYQREQRKNMPDDPNYVEPEITEFIEVVFTVSD